MKQEQETPKAPEDLKRRTDLPRFTALVESVKRKNTTKSKQQEHNKNGTKQI